MLDKRFSTRVNQVTRESYDSSALMWNCRNACSAWVKNSCPPHLIHIYPYLRNVATEQTHLPSLHSCPANDTSHAAKGRCSWRRLLSLVNYIFPVRSHVSFCSSSTYHDHTSYSKVHTAEELRQDCVGLSPNMWKVRLCFSFNFLVPFGHRSGNTEHLSLTKKSELFCKRTCLLTSKYVADVAEKGQDAIHQGIFMFMSCSR